LLCVCVVCFLFSVLSVPPARPPTHPTHPHPPTPTPPGTLTTLQALTSDREIVLPDGRKLMGHLKFEELSKQTGLTFAQLRQRNVFPIHPSFRLVAVGKPAASAEGQTKLSYHWLTPELNTMFLFVWVRNLDQVEESQVLLLIRTCVRTYVRTYVRTATTYCYYNG
jgi:hypothetical protein